MLGNVTLLGRQNTARTWVALLITKGAERQRDMKSQAKQFSKHC